MTLSITPSGFYYPNKIGRITLDAARNLVGESVFANLLQGSGLAHYLNVPPPDNLVREFDFADFAALAAGLDALQAAQSAAPPIPLEVGRMCFREGASAFSSPSFLGALVYGYQMLPLHVKLKIDLVTMATIFTTLSDQHSDVQEYLDHYEYIIHRCPICWGRRGDAPMCGMAVALLEEGLYWSTHRRFDVVETRCCARGDATCTFEIKKPTVADSVSDRNP